MRYIVKSDIEPTCLSEYKEALRAMNYPEPFLYNDFNRTSELRNILCCDQHHVCCYCQRAVRGFRIEHLYPENGPDQDLSKALQLDYYNLFASCIDTTCQPKNLQCCDVAKGNQVIKDFIKQPSCSDLFRYNLQGEILPYGDLHSWKEYKECTSLTGTELEAKNAIEILNLNCPTLVNKRKECIDLLYKSLPSKSKEEWFEKIEEWISSDIYPDFIDLRIKHIYAYFRREEQNQD